MTRVKCSVSHIHAMWTKLGFVPQKGTYLSKAFAKELLTLFSNLTDTRNASSDYPVGEVTLAGFLAVLGGANNWVEMACFCEVQRTWLMKFCPSFRILHPCRCNPDKPGRYTPSHDTFRDVFAMINMAEFQLVTSEFLLANIERIKKDLRIEAGRRLICIDGKEQRHSGRDYSQTADGEVKNIQILHVYDYTNNVNLRSIPIHEKTNEIPVAQKTLRTIYLNNAIVTGDALHTQRLTTQIITSGQADYVLGLKGNQDGLLKDAQELFTEQVLASIRKAHKYYLKAEEKGHGNFEKWEVYVYPVSKFADAETRYEGWANLASFICVRKTIESLTDGSKTVETRFYISSMTDVQDIHESILGHWSVESMHWDEDCVFDEDANTTMDRGAVTNRGTVNLFVNSLLELVQPLFGNVGKKALRKMIGWNMTDGLTLIMAIITEEGLKQACNASSESLDTKAVKDLLDVINAKYHEDSEVKASSEAI